MTDRADKFRSTAAECLALAKSIGDVRLRMALITIAAKLHALADRKRRPSVPQHQPQSGGKE